MTRDARVGRVLVAALQQAIADELPTRSEFYDHWLGPDGRRDGTLGVAPMAAVLGFLRTEGDGYQRVVTRAGRLVAEWTWMERSSWRRQWVTRLPQWLRVRAVCRLVREVVTETCPSTHARCRVARATIALEIRESVFCASRETPAAPLCAFYGALVEAMAAAAGLMVSGSMEQCRTRPGVSIEGRGAGCTGSFVVGSSVLSS